MKFSLNLAQYYSNVDLKGLDKKELLKRIGEQLGAIEDTVDWASKYEDAVIVKVISCEKHPDADKLSICMVTDGSEQPIQIVCGAPNVKKGMYAVWLKPGVVVPSTLTTEPFVLEAKEIRGVMSNGMLASAKELAISDDHSGIVEVPADELGGEPKPGDPLTAYFGLDDFIIELENKMFTHRPDCFGNLGVARELAGITSMEFKSPDWYLQKPNFETVNELSLEVRNDLGSLVPRFMAVVIKNIVIKSSPLWLQAFLNRVGIKPINNVVDITNFVMHLTGQPMHAFDYDKLAACSERPSLMPRMASKDEEITLLGQKKLRLTGEEIVIATDKQAVALAGVMGGADTEVDIGTQAIVLEVATFDMYNIRRTSMRHGIFTDAVTRYTKGQSPYQNDRALAFAIDQLRKYVGAEVASPVADIAVDLKPNMQITVSVDFINDRLGSHLNVEQIASLLRRVECMVDTENNKELIKIQAPFWRTDIALPEDIVEEIGRLYGFNTLPIALPIRSAKPTRRNILREAKQELRETLSSAGANEILSYSFVSEDLLTKTGITAAETAYHIRNAISPDLQYYRPSLTPSILAKIHPNIKAQAGNEANQFALFEIGRVFIKGELDEEKLPEQMERLALVITADSKAPLTQHGSAFYSAKKYLQLITHEEEEIIAIDNSVHAVTAPFEIARSGIVLLSGQKVGVIGEIKSSVRKALKLPEYTAGFELDLSLLRNLLKKSTYTPLSVFPKTQQDITVEVPPEEVFAMTRARLYQRVKDEAQKYGYHWQLIPRSIFKANDAKVKKLTFRLILWHNHRTLTTTEANSLIEAVLGDY